MEKEMNLDGGELGENVANVIEGEDGGEVCDFVSNGIDNRLVLALNEI